MNLQMTDLQAAIGRAQLKKLPGFIARRAELFDIYRSAGLPLTDADPRLINPGDLLHMREGDIPSVRIHQALQYVGHLKSPPPQVVATSNDGSVKP